MHAVDVVFIRSSPDKYDGRVQKIARTLSKKFTVAILSWDREGKLKHIEKIEQNLWAKRFKFRAPYKKVHLALYLPFFWLWVLSNLFALKPRIVHACDLDTVIPSFIYKVLTRAKLVFDSFDKYAIMVSRYGILSKIVEIVENILAYKSDALIVASKDRLSTYGKFLPKFVEVIMNCPDDSLIRHSEQKPEPKIEKKTDELVLVYAGTISRDRGLLILKEAIKGLKDVRLVIAGRDVDGTLKELIREPNVQYVGILPYEDVLRLEMQADVIPVLYDPREPINRMANPNKLFEAMMLGKPVITNVCRDIISECKCGLITEYNVKSVRKAVLLLKSNNVLRKKLGEAGYYAFKRKYNWRYMEKKLFKLYEN